MLWQKTGPYNIHLHGSPAPNTCRCPWGTRQHPPDFTHSHLLLLLPLEVPWPLPASYACDAAEWGSFPLQVALFIEMQPQRFLTGRSKVAFLISLLTGKALLWDRAIWNANSLVINSYDAFINHFKEVFSSATGVLAVSDQLLRLSQGFSTVSDYTLQFCTLAATSGCNEAVPTAPIVMDWVQTSAQLCQSTMTWSDWKISCKKSPVFHNAYWHASPTKPVVSLASPTISLPVPEPYAIGFHLSHSRKTCTPHCGRTLPLLCSYWSLHPELSRQTPTPCGEYPPTRARHFHVISVISTTTHPMITLLQSLPLSTWAILYP